MSNRNSTFSMTIEGTKTKNKILKNLDVIKTNLM
jgi:hypothetical protein